MPNGDIVCELFVGRVHAEFGLLHTGGQHLVTEGNSVWNTIAIERRNLPSSKTGPDAIDLV